MEEQVIESNETAVIAPTSAEISVDMQTVAPTKLEQLEATLKQLKTLGADVAQEEIASIEQKIKDEEDRIKAESEAIIEEVKEIEESFISKYGIGTAHIVEISLLAYCAIRLL